jgi:hypothetical protein
VCSDFPQLVACKASAIFRVVERLKSEVGGKEVIGVLGDLDASAKGEFLERFSKVFPINCLIYIFVPVFFTPGGCM